MKINASITSLIIAAAMVAIVGTAQATCFKDQPGWHMVSKKCNIKPADSWQQYNSGIYTQPMTGKSLLTGKSLF